MMRFSYYRLLFILLFVLIIVVVILQLLFSYRFKTVFSTQYDNTGKAIVGVKQDGFASYAEIDQELVELVLSLEDKRFRSHP